MTHRPLRTMLATVLLVLAFALIAAGCEGYASGTAAQFAGDAPQTHGDDGMTHEGHTPTALPADAPLPGGSLFHLAGTWTDHRGEAFELSELRGGPVLVTMIYASCETACPLLVRDVDRAFDALPDEVRDDTRVLVVSFDPERDAPERLARYVADAGLEHPAWHFAVGNDHGTRALAALLGVRYRPSGNGMFSHTNLIAVLDAGGQVAHRAEGLGLPVDATVRAVVDAATNAASSHAP